jgi:hypothetical protein
MERLKPLFRSRERKDKVVTLASMAGGRYVLYVLRTYPYPQKAPRRPTDAHLIQAGWWDDRYVSVPSGKYNL